MQFAVLKFCPAVLVSDVSCLAVGPSQRSHLPICAVQRCCLCCSEMFVLFRDVVCAVQSCGLCCSEMLFAWCLFAYGQLRCAVQKCYLWCWELFRHVICLSVVSWDVLFRHVVCGVESCSDMLFACLWSVEMCCSEMPFVMFWDVICGVEMCCSDMLFVVLRAFQTCYLPVCCGLRCAVSTVLLRKEVVCSFFEKKHCLTT